MAEELYPEIYSDTKSDKFSIQVAEDLYMAKSYRDEMFRLIRESALENKGKYVYSDLGFIVMPLVISNISGEDYVDYTYNNIFAPLGAYTLCFNPLERFEREHIIPTENDNYFRMQQLHGHVHDQAAAMLGGISGHAGLFGNANDLAKIMEIYLENGKYGGIRYFSDTAVQRFTEYYYEPTFCRRALCWDKPVSARKETEAKVRRTSRLGILVTQALWYGPIPNTIWRWWCLLTVSTQVQRIRKLSSRTFVPTLRRLSTMPLKNKGL
jgi:CubicO group peptidase (beta-lactamase class C family)